MEYFKAFTKATDGTAQCKDFNFGTLEIGQSFRLNNDNPLIYCENGFHCCDNREKIFDFYARNDNTLIAKVSIDPEDSILSAEKCVTRQFTVLEILPPVSQWYDTGERNTGDLNTGYWNTGDKNTGDKNAGYKNTGDRNTGNKNTGDWNTGDLNTGYWNTGDRNTGNWNSGYWNTGDWNTGNRNTGNWNTGDWNTGNWNSGYFNTDDPKVRCFNQDTEYTHAEFSEKFHHILINPNDENVKELPNYSEEVWKELKESLPL